MPNLTRRFLFPFLLLVVLAAGAEPVVKESSGLAMGSHGLVWTQSDGPNPGEKQDRNLYAFTADGTLARVAHVDARNDDWEDLASFVEGGKRYILIADTGDNLARRSESQLYIVEEPTGETAKIAWKLRFRYPNGAHDCEAVTVDMETRRVLLVTKRDAPAQIFAVPLHGRAPVETAVRVGTLWSPPRSSLLSAVFHPLLSPYDHEPTAMDISPDRRRIVVLTYRRAYLWRRKGREAWESVLGREPDQWIPLPGVAQYEGVTFAPDGRALYVSQEGKDGFEIVPLSP